jgi:hypothetical protein
MPMIMDLSLLEVSEWVEDSAWRRAESTGSLLGILHLLVLGSHPCVALSPKRYLILSYKLLKSNTQFNIIYIISNISLS